MPTVKKTIPSTNGTGATSSRRSTNGSSAGQTSVLSRAVPVSEIEDDFVKMVVYGENRTGKTTLACQFPKPLLLVAFEPNKTGGAKSVKKFPGVSYIKLTESGPAVQLAKEVRDQGGFKTVVLDSATSLQDVVLREIMNLSELPEMLSWGTVSRDQYRERSERTREVLRPFLNLDCHVVITAKQKDHNPQDKDRPTIIRGMALESFFAADLGGQTAGWLNDACDYICQLSIQKEIVERTAQVPSSDPKKPAKVKKWMEETGRIIRRLRTMYHPNFAAGFRSENPEAVPEFIDEPTYEKIAQVIRGEKLT